MKIELNDGAAIAIIALAVCAVIAIGIVVGGTKLKKQESQPQTEQTK